MIARRFSHDAAAGSEYIERMKASRGSSAVMKTKLIALRSALPDCIVFAFEGDDDKPVYFQWTKQIRPDLAYEPFVCNGKKQVFVFREMLARDLGGLAKHVYFFIDRDFDDYAGNEPSAETFMTDRYSTENYLVSRTVFEELLKDEFHCHAEPSLREVILNSFEQYLDDFLSTTRDLNRRLFIARRLKIELRKQLPTRVSDIALVTLKGVTPGRLAAQEVVVLSAEPDQADTDRLSAEFDNLDPRERYRGKFSLLFFMKWLELLGEERNDKESDIFKGLNKPRPVQVRGITLGMLASKSEYPTGLRQFIGAIA